MATAHGPANQDSEVADQSALQPISPRGELSEHASTGRPIFGLGRTLLRTEICVVKVQAED